MPLSTETVQNRPLGGRELVEVVVADLRKKLESDGSFAPYIAYSHVTYTISVEFEFENPLNPGAKAEVKGEVGETKGGTKSWYGSKRKRNIDSPNHARGAMGLPIPVQSWEQVEGKPRLVDKNVAYDQKDFPPLPDPEDTDTTAEVMAKAEK